MVNKSDALSDSGNSENDSVKVEIIELEELDNKQKKKRKPGGFKIPIVSARIPQRRFRTVFKNFKNKEPVVTVPIQNDVTRCCSRAILSELDSYSGAQDGINPESTTRLIMEMRNSLQNSDWVSLAKYITVFPDIARERIRWYPTILRYCVIALTQDPLVQGTGLLESFLEGVAGCYTEDEKSEFLSSINKLPMDIHTTKYENLFDDPEPSDDQYLNQQTLQELNDILAKKSLDASSDEDDDTWTSVVSSEKTKSEDEEENTTSDEEIEVNYLGNILKDIENELLSDLGISDDISMNS